MNLNQFRTRAARVSGMSPTDSGDLALIDDWTNEAVVEFLTETKMHVRTASMALTANQGDYTYDDDILAFTDVWHAPASGQPSRLLQPVDTTQLIDWRLQQGAGVDTMSYATQGANLLMLFPAPQSSSDLLHVIYVPRPTAMSLTADTPANSANGNIPEEFHPVLLSYVLWKACEAEEHRPSQGGQSFEQAWDKGLMKAKGAMNRKAGVVRAPAKWGRLGSRRFPLTPGTDLR